MNKLFQDLYLPNATKPKLSPTFAQTMQSAFGLENDLVNVYDYLTRPAREPDPTFDFNATFNASNLPLEWKPILARSQSLGEYQDILARVQKEYKAKAVLAASGWSGTVAAIGAGMLSPTAFIPLVGQGRRGMAIAEMIGLAAAGATAQNAALYYNQETRTEAELYTGIALDTLLGGMLGGAWLGLSREGRARLRGDVEFRQTQVNVPEGPMDLAPVTQKTVRTEAPTRQEYDVTITRPDPVRDIVSTPAAKVETKLEPNFVRVYFSGDVTDVTLPKVGSVDREVATRSSNATPLYYLDLPADDARAVFTEIELTPEELPKLQETFRGPDPKAEEVQSLLRQVEEAELDETDTSVLRGDTYIPEPATTARQTEPVGAQVSRVRNVAGAAPAPNRVRQAAMDVLGKLSPQYRMLTNRFFPSLRNAVAKLDMSGLQQGGLAKAEPSASGGLVIERIKGYDPHIIEFAKVLDREFFTYLYDGAKGIDFDSPALAQIKSTFIGTPPGKMNWVEFKAAVFDGQNTGQFDPKLANAVQAFDRFFKYYTDRQKQYLEEFATQGIEVEPLFKELMEDELGEGVSGYAHHIFDARKMMEKLSEFLDEFSGFYERQLMEDYANAYKRYGKKKAKLELEKAYNALSTPELSARLDEIESDLEFVEEIPEWQAHRQGRLDIMKQGRDEGWSKEKLKEQLAAHKEAMPPDVRELEVERKRLMDIAKTLRKLGGDANKKIEKLQADVAKADDLIDAMFRETMPRILAADLSVARTQKAGDKALKTVTKDLKSVVKALEKRRAQMVKLLNSKRSNSTSRQRVQEHMEKLQVKYAGALERLNAVEGQQVALDEKLSELQLIREDAIADATTLVRSRAARLEDLEDKLEKAQAKIITPEERQRIADQVEEELYNHDRDFELKWGKKGDQSGDPLGGTPDFKERALQMATQLHQKLTGSEVELSPAYHALRQDARGAELLRVMKLPYELKSNWLIKDVELVTRAYDRVMAPDLEIWRAFDGSVNGKSVLGEIQDEVTAHMTRIGTAKYVKLPTGWVDKAAKFNQKVKSRLADFGDSDDVYLEASSFSDTPGPGFVEITPELRTQLGQAVSDAAKAQTYNFDVAIQRLRNTRGVPRDANSYWYRGGRFIKNMNVMTMMGGVVTSSVSDLARPIYQHGIKKTWRHAWAPFINRMAADAKEFRLKSREVNRRIGLNIEPMLHGRAQGLFDLAEDSIGKTKLERAVNLGAQKMGLIALYDYWTAGMKVMAGNVAHATMAEYIPAVADAWRKGVEPTGDVLEMRTYLRSKGLRDLDIHRIALQMEAPGGVERFSNGGVLPNMGAWDDPAAYQAYQSAILTEVNKLIVTPGLERPNVVDENMAYSMLFQFKSFVFASNSRMLMSNLQGNDPYLFQGITFSLAFGALSYYAYANTVGGRTLEEAKKGELDNWIWEAVNRSGMLGALAIGGDIITEVPALGGGDDSVNPAFIKPTRLLGAILGPSYTQLEKMSQFVMNMNTDDPKQQARNMKTLRQVWLPYQNHFILRQALDRIGEAMFGG